MTSQNPRVEDTFVLRYELARGAYDRGEYLDAARALDDLVIELETQHSDTVGGQDAVRHGSTDLRLLLARAYYHSAQLGRAEALLCRLVEEQPSDGYTRLLLARTLQRQSRHDEAAPHIALADALGVDTSTARRHRPA